MENKKNIFILLVLFTLFVLFFLVDSQKQITPTTKPNLDIPTVTPLVNPIASASPYPLLSAKAYDQQIKLSIINILPIYTNAYSIEYFASTADYADYFFVTIKDDPFSKYKKDVEDWFKEQGAKNLDDFTIVFKKMPWVK